MKFNEKEPLKFIMDLLKIDGVSGKEKAVAEYVVRTVTRAGVKKSWIYTDSAHTKSPCRGNTGNLIITLPGTVRGDRIMFSAHMDTVEIAEGAVPVRKGDFIVPEASTALGADDRSGVGVLLNTVVSLMKDKIPHPPLTFLFSIQEEIGLFGTKYLNPSKLKKPVCCYNFDSREPNSLVLQAPSQVVFDAEIRGIAAHAGAHPDRGVSAALIFSQALNRIKDKGYFGAVEKNGRRIATSNVGVLQGGTASNVVMDSLKLRGEVRSYSSSLLNRIVKAYRTSLERAAKGIKNDSGRCGSVVFSVEDVYHTFNVSRTHPAVRKLKSVLKQLGMDTLFPDSPFGGLDANWICSYGIPTVTLGAGEMNPHTPEEKLSIPQYITGCRTALELARR